MISAFGVDHGEVSKAFSVKGLLGARRAASAATHAPLPELPAHLKPGWKPPAAAGAPARSTSGGGMARGSKATSTKPKKEPGHFARSQQYQYGNYRSPWS